MNQKKDSLAIQYAEKALKINSKNSFAYSTLAETYALMGDDENFYKNTELALKYGFPVWEQLDEIPYEKYANQERFLSLIRKYRR
ncbi:MAG: hypothetical protein HC913_06995 [Microscillaceae bacterium]|nr:hypothetical protein [Microscillaceae bacterium]